MIEIETKKDGEEVADLVVHRTIRTFLPHALTPACRASARQIRDIHNTSIYLGRTAFACFEWNNEAKGYILIPEEFRPEGWLAVWDAFNDAVEKINSERATRAKEKGAEPLLIKKLSALDGSAPSSVILNMTVFHRVAKFWSDAKDVQGRSAYCRLPTCLAKPACENARELFCSWLKSISAWRRDAKVSIDFSASTPPRMPSYVKRGSLPSFAIFLESASLPKLAKFGLQLGEDQGIELRFEEAKAFTSFNIVAHVAKALSSWQKTLNAGLSAQAKMAQFTSCGELTRLDVVAEIQFKLPQGSFFEELSRRMPQEWSAKQNDQDLLEDWVVDLAKGQTWNAKTVDSLNSHAWISQNFGAMGIDPGQNNLLSLGFSGGAKMRVFSGQAFERKMANFDARLDKVASRLTTQEQRDLAAKIQAVKNGGGRAEDVDVARLRAPASQVWRDPKILSLRQKKQAYQKDQAHRLARMVARQAAEQKVGVAILSRNKGMKKNAKDLSKAANRRSHNIPQNLFAQLLREKLLLLGIAMVESEESFTSQASFVDGDPLPVHGEGAKQMAARDRKVQAKLAKRGTPQPLDTPPIAGPDQKESRLASNPFGRGSVSSAKEK